MAVQAARIETSLGFNDSEFLTGIARAEKRAASFGNRLEKSVSQTFRKHGSAQTTIANFSDNLLRGDLPSAIRGLTFGMAGIGLAAGIGVAVAGEQILKLAEHIKETEKARSDLGDLMSRPMQLIVDAGGAQEYIATLTKQADALQEKISGTNQNVLDALQFTYGSGDEKKETSQRQREINQARVRADETARLSGRRDLSRTNVLAGISDPKRRALAEQRMKFDDQEAALKAKPDKGSRARLEALKVESAEFEKKYNLQKQGDKEAETSAARQFETAKKLIALGQSGLGDDVQKRLAAQMRLGDIEKDLKGGSLSIEQRRKLELEGLQQEGILRSGRPDDVEERLAAQKRPQEDWGRSLVRMNIEKSLGYGGMARSRIESGEFHSPEEALLGTGTSAPDIARYKEKEGVLPGDNLSGDLLQELQTLNTNMTKYWGGG